MKKMILGLLVLTSVVLVGCEQKETSEVDGVQSGNNEISISTTREQEDEFTESITSNKDSICYMLDDADKEWVETITEKMPKQKVTDGLLMSIESIDQYDKLVEVKLNFKQSSSDSFQEVYIPQDTKLIYNGEEINCLSKSYRSELSDDKKTLDIYITCSLSEHLALDEIQLSISKLISCSEMKKYSLKEYQGNWSATAYVNKIDSENFAFDYISEEKQVELCGKTIQVESVECGNNVVMLICEKVVSEKESLVDYTSNILDESGTKTGVYVTVVYDDNSKENLECSLDAENNIIALAPEGLTKREIAEVQIGDLRFAKR